MTVKLTALAGAEIRIAVADESLRARLAGAIGAAVTAAVPPLPAPRIVRLRTRARAHALPPARVAGAFVVVPVTAGNARHLLEIVRAVRGKRPAGVQLVADDASGAWPRIERHVFALLEHVRATPKEPPVVVARTGEPALALRLLALGPAEEGRADPRC